MFHESNSKLIGDLPHGIRLNNPFNLKATNIPWNGKVDPVGRFEAFADPVFGLRAGIKDVYNDYIKDGKRTVRKLINEFAPPVENNTSAYVVAVSQALGVGPDDEISLPAQLPALVRAIVKHENGAEYEYYYSAALINVAISEALA